MKVNDTQLGPMMELALARFVETHKLDLDLYLRASFFAGAAVAIASQDGSQEAVKAMTDLATEALEVQS